jgi:vacuolar-type H+-ATPase subunit I/STV1
MVAQPQQPIYPDQLTQALDRLFLRVTAFINAQTDNIMTQMRVDKQEAIAREQAMRLEILAQMRADKQEAIAREQAMRQEIFAKLDETRSEMLQRVEAVENNQRSLADAILTLTSKVNDISTYQQAMTEASKAQTADILQVVRGLHAEAMGAINELRQKGNEEQ